MADEEKLATTKAEKASSESESDEDTQMSLIRQFFAQKLSLGASHIEEPKKKVIEDLTLDGLISHWNSKGFKNIITLVGAGISTSAGIPDFRSPGTGLYDNLQKYNLPYAMAIFDINYFHTNPKPFFTLAKELYPGNFKPTPSHYFVRLLHEKGLLQRHYTQNIDTLERVAGIPEEKLVEAHGTFYTNHCIKCHASYTKEWVKEYVFNDEVPICTKCKGVVKPDIVFFGEDLPQLFYTKPVEDFVKCDLLIVMGTSLEVYPFATLLEHATPKTVRLIINRTKIVDLEDNNTRDVEFLGDCDEAVSKLCEGLGWTEELKTLLESEHAKLDEVINSSTSSTEKSLEKKDIKEEKKVENEDSSDKENLDQSQAAPSKTT